METQLLLYNVMEKNVPLESLWKIGTLKKGFGKRIGSCSYEKLGILQMGRRDLQVRPAVLRTQFLTFRSLLGLKKQKKPLKGP